MNKDNVDKDSYTQEYRVRMFREMQEQKEEDEKRKNENSMFKDFREMEEQNR